MRTVPQTTMSQARNLPAARSPPASIVRVRPASFRSPRSETFEPRIADWRGLSGKQTEAGTAAQGCNIAQSASKGAMADALRTIRGAEMNPFHKFDPL